MEVFVTHAIVFAAGLAIGAYLWYRFGTRVLNDANVIKKTL